MIHTLTLYHPLRPVCCLEAALSSLRGSGYRQRVEVIVQGDLRADVQLPDPAAFIDDGLKIVYLFNKRNMGNSIPVKRSIERFLSSDAKWFCKWDDDMSAEPGWQGKLIRGLKFAKGKGHKVGAAMIAPPAYLFAGVPRNRATNGGVLRWAQGHWDLIRGGGSEYYVCDFADHGATVFSREMLESGVRPDTNLFVGGVDFDMVLQMLERGYLSVLMTKPRCAHHHEECKPFDYGQIRYSYKQIQKSAAYLEKKWGLEIRYLKRFKGGPWMTKKPQRPTGEHWHREAVAGKRWKEEGVWGAVGKLQLEFLKGQGMKPRHKLLEFGCGAGRAGVHFAKYLKPGNYYGVDKEPDLLKAFRNVEAPRYKVNPGLLSLTTIRDFDLTVLPKALRFDYAIAHSILTHLSIQDCHRCVRVVMKRMKPQGSFYATFHESKDGSFDESETLKGFQAWRNKHGEERLLTVYPFELMEEIAQEAGCFVEYIGDWGHKYNPMGRQMMVRFFSGQRS